MELIEWADDFHLMEFVTFLRREQTSRLGAIFNTCLTVMHICRLIWFDFEIGATWKCVQDVFDSYNQVTEINTKKTTHKMNLSWPMMSMLKIHTYNNNNNTSRKSSFMEWDILTLQILKTKCSIFFGRFLFLLFVVSVQATLFIQDIYISK